MIIGYARSSTVDQMAGFEAQLRDLQAAGVEKIFHEQTSAVGDRPQLAAALDYLRDGDLLVVTKLDRLARSVVNLGQIVETLKAKKAGLKVLNLGIDTSSATGELIMSLLASVAAFERSMMLERQREGIAKAKAEGKYRGRAPTARRRLAEIQSLRAEGVGAAEIARRLGIGRGSVYRVLAQAAG